MEEISYENKTDKNTLAGTFTRPKIGSQFTTILLITGSGLQDRDQTVLNHRPFLIIADYLTRQDFAVLRVDDRGVGGSYGGDPANATTENFIGDVRAGVEYLKSRKDIIPDKIGLIGHSEGGIIAATLASQSDDIAFIVLLASPGMPGNEILISQDMAMNRASGESEMDINAKSQLQRLWLDVLKKNNEESKIRAELMDRLKKWKADQPDEVRANISHLDESYWNEQVKRYLISWMRCFVRLDPRVALRKVKCPVLALHGAKDMQVLPDLNLPQIEKALAEAGNENYRIEKLEGLNHLFQHCQTGMVDEYGIIEETFAPEVLKLISDWIFEMTR